MPVSIVTDPNLPEEDADGILQAWVWNSEFLVNLDGEAWRRHTLLSERRTRRVRSASNQRCAEGEGCGSRVVGSVSLAPEEDSRKGSSC
jgi:hypothetical protein